MSTTGEVQAKNEGLRREERVKRVMCIMILHSRSMVRAHRGVRLQRDHAQKQLEVNCQVCRLEVNCSLHFREMFTCFSFLILYTHTLMTLLISVTMEIVVFGLLQLYLDGAKSHGL